MTELRLRSLGDAAIPPLLRDELRLVRQLDEHARDGFGLLLSMAIAEHPGRSLDEHVGAFAERHGMAGADLAKALRAHRFVLREASQRDVEPPAYAADLQRLAADDAEADRLQSLLLPAFVPAMNQLREERIAGAISDHGKVVVGVRWRVDSMLASDRGSAETMRVGLLTLQLREGGRHDQITMQVLPDMLDTLATACQSMIDA